MSKRNRLHTFCFYTTNPSYRSCVAEVKIIMSSESNVDCKINEDYVGVVISQGNVLEYKQIPIEKSDDVRAKLKDMLGNDNKNRMDLQSFFQITFPDENYYHYSIPYEYNNSFISGIAYPPVWNMATYEQKLSERVGEKHAGEESYIRAAAKDLKDQYYRECDRYLMAFDLYRVLLSIEKNPKVKMYSRERIGWNEFIYKVSNDIQVLVKTNFSYGSASYFFVGVTYKGIELLPYTAMVNYYHVDMIDFIRYTRQYAPKRMYWDASLKFVVETSNFAARDEKGFLQTWCLTEVDEMIKELARIDTDAKKVLENHMGNTGSAYIGEYYYARHMNDKERQYYKFYPDEVSMVFRAEKLTNALSLLDKMQSLTQIFEEVNDRIEIIKQMNIGILPEIENKISKIKIDIQNREKDIEIIRRDTIQPLECPIKKYEELELQWLEQKEQEYINNKREEILKLRTYESDDELNREIELINWSNIERTKEKEEYRKINEKLYKEYKEMVSKRSLAFIKIDKIKNDINCRQEFLYLLGKCKRIIDDSGVAKSA